MKRKTLSILLIFAAAFGAISCSGGGGGNNDAAGIVVINAPVTGKIRRVLVKEGTDVVENTGIIEITVPPKVPVPEASGTPAGQTMRNVQAEIRSAEDELERASVELQRIEPLVASNSAPQSHLDAARAQYQQAQERLDALRRQSALPPNPASTEGTGNVNTSRNAPVENIVVVRAPAGSVRVISVREGQSIRAGEPVATISAPR
jgi:multidrug efflux pump subunit AcrA (membrane-fusion protein)